MEANNWRPHRPGGEAPLDQGDWRAQLQPGTRQKIVNKVMETLKRHIPCSGPEGMNELGKIASRFEEKTYRAALNQMDYMRKISMKMVSMENRSQNAPSNSVLPGFSVDANITQDPAPNQTQLRPISLPANQAPTRQNMLPQVNQNNVNISGSTSIAPSIPPASGLPQATNPSLVGHSSNIQNISRISQINSTGNTLGQRIPSNMAANSLRQMQQGRPQVFAQQQQQQQQQQSQNSNYLYEEQVQHLLRRKLRQGNLHPSVMQQNLLLPNQLQSSQQTSSIKQPSLMQPAHSSGLQQNQEPSTMQHPQSSIRQQHPSQQAGSIHQQQTSVSEQFVVPSQEEHLVDQQMSNVPMQTGQFIGQENSGDLPQLQQKQPPNGLLTQQTDFQQQQVISQHNNPSNIHPQTLSFQSNISAGLSHQQQQQLPDSHSPLPSLQSKVSLQQRQQQPGSSLLTTQGQHSQPQQLQAPQQHMTGHQFQSQSMQLQRQSQTQQSVQYQRDTQQRLRATVRSCQTKDITDQHQQLYQQQTALPENPTDSAAQTGNAGGGDWQEALHQKINTLKEKYLPELSEMHQKLAVKVQQHDSIQHQPKSEQLDRLRTYKLLLEHVIQYLSIPKENLLPSHREKFSSYEKHILNFANNQRSKKPMQQGQLPKAQMQSMQQTQSHVSHVSQVLCHDNQIQANPPLKSTVFQNSTLSNLHKSQLPSSGASALQQNISGPPQPDSSTDPGLDNALPSSQKVLMSSLSQNPSSTCQQPSVSLVQSQSGILQQHHLKPQEQHQHIFQNQQLKQQLQQRQIQEQMMQKQHLMQQQQQLQKQHAQVPHLHQMNSEVSDLRMRQGMNVKSVSLQQHPSGQHPLPTVQQSKTEGTQLSNSSPQSSQVVSPQMAQHLSPQLDHPNQNLAHVVSKAGTPLGPANSPFVVPSPAPGDYEKPVTTSILNAVNITNPQTTQSLANSTLMKSPLLAQDAICETARMNVPTKQGVEEQPIERLIKAVSSASTKSLASSISDIGSVINTMNTMAGSAPGEGSRAAIGDDLVATTKFRLLSRNSVPHDGSDSTRKLKRCMNAKPFDISSSSPDASIFDYSNRIGCADSDGESAVRSCLKKLKCEPKNTLMEEIKEINQQLIDTVIDFSDEVQSEGTIVKCCFGAVALCPSLKSLYASAQLTPIQPLRLLVPRNYPDCSPILLDKFPVEFRDHDDNLFVKAKSRFSRSLGMLAEPMSLIDIARTWDSCSRAVVTEFAEQRGGGTFSSRFGSWENCLTNPIIISNLWSRS